MNENIWKTQFARQLNDLEIPDQWELCFDMNLTDQDTGVIYAQYTFGSFHCSCCSRSWNSLKVFILFLLNHNKRWRHGTVRMRIFKQGCESCIYREESPTIKHENISRAVYNLAHKIQRKFYEVNDDYEEQNPQRFGPLDGPHNRELCEACRYGLCEKRSSGEQNKMESEGSVIPGVLCALGVGALVVGIGALALHFAENNDSEKKRKK